MQKLPEPFGVTRGDEWTDECRSQVTADEHGNLILVPERHRNAMRTVNDIGVDPKGTEI
jgi:hypothetical protein